GEVEDARAVAEDGGDEGARAAGEDADAGGVRDARHHRPDGVRVEVHEVDLPAVPARHDGHVVGGRHRGGVVADGDDGERGARGDVEDGEVIGGGVGREDAVVGRREGDGLEVVGLGGDAHVEGEDGAAGAGGRGEAEGVE